MQVRNSTLFRSRCVANIKGRVVSTKMPLKDAKKGIGGAFQKAGGGGDAKAKTGRDSGEGEVLLEGEQPVEKKQDRKRKDGTVNKMSFDVDELEEGLYIQVEDEEDVETVVEYVEVPDDEIVPTEGEGEKVAEMPKYGLDKAGADETAGGYKIRPDLTRKFRPGAVQAIIETAIKEKLEGKEYNVEECDEWTRLILEDIHEKVKSQDYKRYKIISQIILGERRGEGVSCATRCLWDAEADCLATYTFLNDTIFCSATVYGIYYY